MSKHTYVTGYYRVGSAEQIGKKLNNIHNEIAVEEQNMRDLAERFLASSERYDSLINTQRSLTAQLFSLKQRPEASKKRG